MTAWLKKTCFFNNFFSEGQKDSEPMYLTIYEEAEYTSLGPESLRPSFPNNPNPSLKP